MYLPTNLKKFRFIVNFILQNLKSFLYTSIHVNITYKGKNRQTNLVFDSKKIVNG